MNFLNIRPWFFRSQRKQNWKKVHGIGHHEVYLPPLSCSTELSQNSHGICKTQYVVNEQHHNDNVSHLFRCCLPLIVYWARSWNFSIYCGTLLPTSLRYIWKFSHVSNSFSFGDNLTISNCKWQHKGKLFEAICDSAAIKGSQAKSIILLISNCKVTFIRKYC